MPGAGMKILLYVSQVSCHTGYMFVHIYNYILYIWTVNREKQAEKLSSRYSVKVLCSIQEKRSDEMSEVKKLTGMFPWLLHITPVFLQLNDERLLSKGLQINGRFREISSLAQWSVYATVVSTGIYYAAALNTRTHTHTTSQQGLRTYAAKVFQPLRCTVAVLLGGEDRGGAGLKKRSYF